MLNKFRTIFSGGDDIPTIPFIERKEFRKGASFDVDEHK